MPNINTDILVWAREEAGLSLEESANALGLQTTKTATAVEKLVAFEEGKQPSRAMVCEFARVYRRPILTFYLDKKPKKIDRGEDFRTLHADLDVKQEYRVSVLVRDVKARQAIVRQILIDEEEDEPLEFIGKVNLKDGVQSAVSILRRTLGMKLSEYRTRRNHDEAFKFLRRAVEQLGVFVVLKGNLGSYHTNIDLKIFRGFALSDNVAPFIVINHLEAKSARAFTLIHELTHLLLGQTGISGDNRSDGNQIEKFCDEVASEFLLPEKEIASFSIDTDDFDDIKDRISNFASNRHISATSIAYRLWDRGVYDQATFNKLKKYYLKLFNDNRDREKEKNKGKEGGPNQNIIRRLYLGGLVNFVQRMSSTGAMSATKAGVVLGVKPLKINNLFEISQT